MIKSFSSGCARLSLYVSLTLFVKAFHGDGEVGVWIVAVLNVMLKSNL